MPSTYCAIFSSQASKSAISVTDIEADGIVFRDENIEVTAAVNSHYQLLDHTVGTKSFSYRIKTAAGIIVITGDTGISDAVMELSRDADVLISESMDMIAIRKYLEAQTALGVVAPEAVEPSMAHLRAGHLDLPEVGRIATSARVGTILLTHFGPEADITTPDKIIAAVRTTFDGPIFAAKDLDRYCLTSKSQGRRAQIKAC
jgi:ribonuclease BN (tRNA processing enzyme)